MVQPAPVRYGAGMPMLTPLTILIATLLACTVISIGLTAWALGQVRVWRAYGLAWKAQALRTPRVPAPALTIVAPEFHAPRADFRSRVGGGSRS